MQTYQQEFHITDTLVEKLEILFYNWNYLHLFQTSILLLIDLTQSHPISLTLFDTRCYMCSLWYHYVSTVWCGEIQDVLRSHITCYIINHSVHFLLCTIHTKFTRIKVIYIHYILLSILFLFFSYFLHLNLFLFVSSFYSISCLDKAILFLIVLFLLCPIHESNLQSCYHQHSLSTKTKLHNLIWRADWDLIFYS